MALVVASLSWMFTTRTIRAQVLTIRERSYVEVARVNGESAIEVLFSEIMPNLLPFIVASFVGTVGSAILAVIGLEALGLGALGGDDARQYHLLVAAIGGGAARLLVVVGPTDRRDRVDLPRPVPHLDRLRPLRQSQADPPHMTVSAQPIPAAGFAVAPPILVVQALSVHYDTVSGPAKAVNDVSFSLRPGERLGLIGESGSGKTTVATRVDAADAGAWSDRSRQH